MRYLCESGKVRGAPDTWVRDPFCNRRMFHIIFHDGTLHLPQRQCMPVAYLIIISNRKDSTLVMLFSVFLV